MFIIDVQGHILSPFYGGLGMTIIINFKKQYKLQTTHDYFNFLNHFTFLTDGSRVFITNTTQTPADISALSTEHLVPGEDLNVLGISLESSMTEDPVQCHITCMLRTNMTCQGFILSTEGVCLLLGELEII